MEEEDTFTAGALAQIEPEAQTESPMTRNTEGGPEDAPAPSEEDNGVHTFTVKCGDQDYLVTHSADQWKRLQDIIYPKDVVTDQNAAQVTADHIQSVKNWCDLYINLELAAIADHDARKLHQTPDEHHKLEAHHWPLDGFEIKHGYLPLQYVAEALCDYAATVYGRAFAGRGLDWMPPTNKQTAADSMAATFLFMIEYYDLGTVTPALPTLGGKDDAEEHPAE
jgi:hypothetical protein